MRESKTIDAIKRAPIENNVPGWTVTTTFAVGGLEAVGFDERNGELLVVSSQGQGIIDPTSGRRLFRDANSHGYDHKRLQANRGDQPEAPPVRMAGIHGGHLRTVNDDGWTIEKVVLEWPKARLVLCEPNVHLSPFKKPPKSGWFVLGEGTEFKVWGFSHTGSVLIWSDEVDISVLRKD